MATSSAAMDGCSAAVEISQLEVPINATLAPMVRLPSRTDRATHPQEPLRKDKSRGKIAWLCLTSARAAWDAALLPARVETRARSPAAALIVLLASDIRLSTL